MACLVLGVGLRVLLPCGASHATLFTVLGALAPEGQRCLVGVVDGGWAGGDLIARLGLGRAGKGLNGFVAPTAAKLADVPA